MDIFFIMVAMGGIATISPQKNLLKSTVALHCCVEFCEVVYKGHIQ